MTDGMAASRLPPKSGRLGLQTSAFAACVLQVLLLAGCGGGGGGGGGGGNSTTTTSSSSTTSTSIDLYSCHSTLKLSTPKSITRKGMCLDDTTFQACAQNITALWPHTDSRVGALRLFKAWEPTWGDDSARRRAWAMLAAFVRQNNASVLMGVEVTCDEAHDDQVWDWTLELMHMLGPDSILAVALGNEMELFFQKPNVTAPCMQKLWHGGRYFDTLVKRAADLDSREAFKSVRLTSVFGGYSKTTWPFIDAPNSQVLTYLRQAWRKFQDRWVWSFNVYPFWDNRCSGDFASVPGGMADFRSRVKAVTGRNNDTMWMTETGWSSAPPQAYHEPCKGYCSKERLQRYYEDFMRWELGGPVDGDTDLAFYFTMRDSRNFNINESFGLVATCADTECKLQAAETEVVV